MKKKPMAKTMPVVDDEMRSEYDFAGGVRGKHCQVLREEGYIVRIYTDDGTVTERHVAREVSSKRQSSGVNHSATQG